MKKHFNGMRIQRNMAKRSGTQWAAWLLAIVCGVIAFPARASIALLMEEPYGTFGAFNPTGHAAVYLNRVCAETTTQLRPCVPGEYGVVISRYHKIDGYDWIAIPLIPYLYAVNDANDVPTTVDKHQEAALRDAYRRAHLESLAPDNDQGGTPGGEWIQLVGSSYDRTLHGFQFATTPEQDARFIALFNDKRNTAHFNLLFRNCADFSRGVFDLYLPGSAHRNFIADVGLTTPKQLARSLMKYGHEHPELEMSAFVIRQVPGSIPRSHPVDGVVESLLKSKKYIIPLTVLRPELTAGIIVAYMANGRLSLPKGAPVFNAEDFAAGERPGALSSAPADPQAEPEPGSEASPEPSAAPGGGAVHSSGNLLP
jgi:hypothetical protein